MDPAQTLEGKRVDASLRRCEVRHTDAMGDTHTHTHTHAHTQMLLLLPISAFVCSKPSKAASGRHCPVSAMRPAIRRAPGVAVGSSLRFLGEATNIATRTATTMHLLMVRVCSLRAHWFVHVCVCVCVCVYVALSYARPRCSRTTEARNRRRHVWLVQSGQHVLHEQCHSGAAAHRATGGVLSGSATLQGGQP